MIIRKKKGFTLAEILIVLAVIGIVSAITLPSFQHNAAERQNAVKLAKARNVIESAIATAMTEELVDTAGDLTCDKIIEQIKGVGHNCEITTRDEIILTFKKVSADRINAVDINLNGHNSYTLSIGDDGRTSPAPKTEAERLLKMAAGNGNR